MDSHLFLTTQEVADHFRTTPRHIRELRARGELPCVKVGRLVRYRQSDVVAYGARTTPARLPAVQP